jgi:hypothetical protein
MPLQAADEAKQKAREEEKAARRRYAQNLSGDLPPPENRPAQPSHASRHSPSAPSASGHAALDQPQGSSRVLQGVKRTPEFCQGLATSPGASQGIADPEVADLRGSQEGKPQEEADAVDRQNLGGAGPGNPLQAGEGGDRGLPNEGATGRTAAEPAPQDSAHEGRTLAESFRIASSGAKAGKAKQGKRERGEESGPGGGSNPGPRADVGGRAGIGALYQPTRRALKRKEFSKMKKLKKKGRLGKDQEPDLEAELLVDHFKPKFGEQALEPLEVRSPLFTICFPGGILEVM